MIKFKKRISRSVLTAIFLIPIITLPTLALASDASILVSEQETAAAQSPSANTVIKTSTAPLPIAVAAENSTVIASETSDDLAEPELKPSLEILGAQVLPGTAEVVSWGFETTFADLSVPVPVLVVNGSMPGPTLCLTAAVHGDELNGIEIVRRIVHETNPEKLAGAIIGVPIVNLQGFQRANRYLPDRRDLNRYFPGRESGSYASRVAHSFFERVISHCNYLVDLHTGSLSRTNLPQIRANLSDPAVASLAEKMGSIVVLQSRGGSGTLRRAATDAGIAAVTLEAGAPNNLQKDAVEQGVKSIKSAISSLGMSDKPFWKRSAEPVFYRSKWIRARTGGILFSKVELGDNVEVNQVLGLLSDPITNKATKINSTIAGRVIGMALNQVMYPGYAAYHIGLKSSMVETAEKDKLPEEAKVEIEADSPVEKTLGEQSQITDPTDSETEAPVLPQPVIIQTTPIEEMELPTAEPD